MAEQSFVEESYDRVQDTVRSWGDELEKMQKEFNKRRKRFEKDAQKRVKRVRGEIRKSALVKRAEALQKDATKQIETGVDTVLDRLQIASRSDVKRLEKKVAKLSKQLRDFEKTSE